MWQHVIWSVSLLFEAIELLKLNATINKLIHRMITVVIDYNPWDHLRRWQYNHFCLSLWDHLSSPWSFVAYTLATIVHWVCVETTPFLVWGLINLTSSNIILQFQRNKIVFCWPWFLGVPNRSQLHSRPNNLVLAHLDKSLVVHGFLRW